MKVFFTLVQHSGWVVARKTGFQKAVEICSVESPDDIQRIRDANGFLFPSYKECSQREYFENYEATPVDPNSLYPLAPGTFLEDVLIDGAPLYLPNFNPDEENEKS